MPNTNPTKLFNLVSNYEPAGDQITAIEQVSSWLEAGVRDMTIHGVTGSGKTFTMANIIDKVNRPAIIYSPNKVLAYQLYEELKAFFPDNAVHYYVSTFDLYRPEFVKNNEFHTKQSVTNEILEQMVLDATTALSTGRRDTIIVTSLSCIYGTGAPEMYRKSIIDLNLETPISMAELVARLEHSGYQETPRKLARGLYRRTESKAYICAHAYEDKMKVWELRFDDQGYLEQIHFRTRDVATGEILESRTNLSSGHIYPATRHTQDYYTNEEIDLIGQKMLKEAAKQRNELHPNQYDLLVQRIEDDINELKRSGYCNGIENYAWYFNRQNLDREYSPDDYENMRPYTLMSYLAKDTVFFIDESHLALGQIQAASSADFSRKKDLISNGIRLPSCVINRPLKGKEVRELDFQTVYVSATPNPRELELSGKEHVARLFIRPTYLLDPEVEVVYVDQLEGISYTQHVIQQIEQTRKNGGAVLLRCPDSKIARNYELLLQDLGFKAKVMLAETPAPERRELVERLQAVDPNLEALDVIIGVNLIREGLDIPRVEKVLIVYADVGGFLNDTTSLIQVIGRAARNTKGKVYIYMNNPNKMTSQIQEAIDQTQARRQLQMDYNRQHHKTPRTAVANSYLNNMIARSYQADHEDLFADVEDLGFNLNEQGNLSQDPEQEMILARRVALNQASIRAATQALAQIEANEIEAGLRPQPSEPQKKRGIPLPGSPEYETWLASQKEQTAEVGSDLSETKINIFSSRRRRKS
ncbi:helicase-related protein [Psittacicella gerlachiana]|uniref:Excinuclease ABC subunit B n=1 Tax=Psittacicella gerlachiana TaxID=2028574 RepID=A0A3A1YEI9_9GAMM|nr:helicase-related protein [Psittacicella gerlachiana]RIY35846.1 hypothetical protein CKF59_03215 [Psittacicella gerlachiana]